MLFILSLFSVISLLDLADSLYAAKHFYDAVTEYKRFHYHFPNDSHSDYARFQLGLSYLESKEYFKAETTLRKIFESSNQYSQKAKSVLIEYFIQNQQYALARIELQDLLLFSSDSIIRKESNRRLGGIELVEDNLSQAINYFSFINDSILVKETEHLKRLPRKNPGIAMLLSTFLPGTGEIYCGRYPAGIAAFLINAATLATFIYSVNKKNYVDATLVFSIFFSRFYFGSRQNAHDFAVEYNRRIFSKQIKLLNQQFNLFPNP